MNLQYISDNKGKTTGVFIPIQDWNKLKKKYRDLEPDVDKEQSKEEILSGIKQAVKEVTLVKQGKLKARDAKELINEL